MRKKIGTRFPPQRSVGFDRSVTRSCAGGTGGPRIHQLAGGPRTQEARRQFERFAESGGLSDFPGWGAKRGWSGLRKE